MKQTKQKKTFTAFHKTYVVLLFFFKLPILYDNNIRSIFQMALLI